MSVCEFGSSSIARLNSLSAFDQSLSYIILTHASDVCASASVSSITSALIAAVFAFGLVSQGGNIP